ncbi:hypothetical protein [Psychromonas aquimarina]|uniref:hypothetical protein n=1 Tax=Psychromonas aquimarina TaxID=444919 RepID=UPI000490851F|nr:hypothetical protein [Psychromonas aquimarina]
MEQKFIYSKGKYHLTAEEFKYLGYTEKLKNVADLEVVESFFKNKLVAGATLSVWGLLFSFFPGFLIALILPEIITESTMDPQVIVSIFCVAVAFMLGFILRPKYRLYITKVNGNKGSIGRNHSSRGQFDELIRVVKATISKNC